MDEQIKNNNIISNESSENKNINEHTPEEETKDKTNEITEQETKPELIKLTPPITNYPLRSRRKQFQNNFNSNIDDLNPNNIYVSQQEFENPEGKFIIF